jgi:hypothetical protein
MIKSGKGFLALLHILPGEPDTVTIYIPAIYSHYGNWVNIIDEFSEI